MVPGLDTPRVTVGCTSGRLSPQRSVSDVYYPETGGRGKEGVGSRNPVEEDESRQRERRDVQKQVPLLERPKMVL